jgi:hypothetical protein
MNIITTMRTFTIIAEERRLLALFVDADSCDDVSRLTDKILGLSDLESLEKGADLTEITFFSCGQL